jgi:3-hydroxyisobutyrate dehydrogenase-like beta-hydroxyacid dehydrogenase
MARELDRPVPLASAARHQMQSARLAGLGTQDVSAVFASLAGQSTAPKK